MTSRLLAGGVLVASVVLAWLAVNLWIVARLLQALAGLSLVYVTMLAYRGWRVLREALAHARSGAGEPTGRASDLPFVSLAVPARNEAAVVAGTVRDLAAMGYHGADGAPRYEVVIVDDGSTDGTGRVAREIADNHAHVRVVRREAGSGLATKGAVLAWAMPFLRGEVIGAVDADTRVEPAFLERAMRAWGRDADAAAVQAERRERNAGRSWLTTAQEVEELMDVASQCGRWATDGTAELRGNGMFVRRTALEAAGGWSAHALTEDLDLSTRLSAIGAHVTLAPEAVVAQEAVETVAALWRQHMRWAEGSLRRLLEYGPRLLAEGVPMGRKVDFLIFTTEFIVPPLFVAAIAAGLVTAAFPGPADWTVPASLFVAYGTGTFLLAVAGLAAHGDRGWRLLGRATLGALFLSHWLVVVPAALGRIAFLPGRGSFTPTARFGSDPNE
jgi:1,2-diacylglycerol 3-beta-glucosyltransferase